MDQIPRAPAGSDRVAPPASINRSEPREAASRTLLDRSCPEAALAPGIVDRRYEARLIGNASWSRGDGPAAAIAIARRLDALNSSHDGHVHSRS